MRTDRAGCEPLVLSLCQNMKPCCGCLGPVREFEDTVSSLGLVRRETLENLWLCQGGNLPP